MSRATTWPLPNQAYTRCPSVAGVGVARLCFSWSSGIGPVALARYSQRRTPSDRRNASTTSQTSLPGRRRFRAPAANRLLPLGERSVVPGELRMRAAGHDGAPHL